MKCELKISSSLKQKYEYYVVDVGLKTTSLSLSHPVLMSSEEELAAVVPLLPNSRFKSGYCLVLRSNPLKTPCPSGGYFYTEYDICRALNVSSARKLKRSHAKALALLPQQNDATGRWDLGVYLVASGGARYHTFYHRVVGLTLVETEHNVKGRKLSKPKIVPEEQWDEYEVDHADWNNLDNRVRNLRVRHKLRHRGQGRDEWQKKALTHGQKARMVRQSISKKPARA